MKSIIGIIFIILFLVAPMQAQVLDNLTIVIDAGHGGKDSGCQGLGGTVEKDITLDLNRRLQKFFKQRTPMNILMTRDTDETISLNRRGSFANNNQADILISLHANASFNKQSEGLYIYYYETSEIDFKSDTKERVKQYWGRGQLPYIEESKQLAQYIADEARLSNIWRRVSVRALPLYILKCVSMPAVLIETEFLSSHQGERKLLNPNYRQKIAECFYRGIMRYLK